MYRTHLLASFVLALSCGATALGDQNPPPLPGQTNPATSLNPSTSLTGGPGGIKLQQAPIPIGLNCSSVIMQGNANFMHWYFVLPRGFLGIDAGGENLIQILPQANTAKPISTTNPA